MHEGVEALVGIFMPCVGEVEGHHRGFELGMAQGALDQPGIDARFQQMGGVGVSQGMDGHAGFGHAGTMFGCAEGALDTGPAHGHGCRRTLLLLPPGGGKEPGRVPVGFPGGTEQREGLGGQRDVAVFGALAAVDMDLEALAIDIGDLQEEGFLESEAQARDGGKGDLVMQGRGGAEEPPDFLYTEDGGKMVCGLRAQEGEGMPVALKDVLREEADATRTDAHGRGGEAIDIFPVQEVTLQLLCRDAVGGFVVALSQQADFADRGFLRPFTFATALKRRNHMLTQWGHERSPFVRRVVRLRRKTS